MKRKYYPLLILLLITLNLLANRNYGNKSDSKLKNLATQWVKSLPVEFLENKGQMRDINGKPATYIFFRAEAPGISMYVTESGLSYMFVKSEEEHNKGELSGSKGIPGLPTNEKNNRFPGNMNSGGLREIGERIKVECSRIDMSLVGANIKRENIITEGASAWVNHYYLGLPPDGIRDVHGYKKVTIKEIYPGIDWVLYNSDTEGFKYDFIVHPGSNPGQIKLLYRSDKSINIDRDGNIHIKTPIGTLTENTPVCYIDETKDNIPAKFIKTKFSSTNEISQEQSEISFSLGSYDNSKTLVIDPQLWWGTYIHKNVANTSCGPMSIDCDAGGNVYVTGYAAFNAPLMPWGNAFYISSSAQLFVLRFTNTGVLTWGTYFGAYNFIPGLGDTDWSIPPTYLTIDNSGNIYIVGYTFGTISSAQSWGAAYFDPTFNSGCGGPCGLITLPIDAFIVRFSNTGALQWATHFGGDGIDVATSINIAPNGNIYITGYTGSADFPSQAWGSAYYDGGFNGGTADAFVSGFNNSGQLLWSTYFGGNSVDMGYSVTTDLSGNVYVSGLTSSGNFPIQSQSCAYNDPGFNGGIDAFVAKFSNTGQLQWSTFLGGSSNDYTMTIGTDPNNNLYVTGITKSADFPVQSWGTAYYDGILSGAQDVYISRFNPAGVLTWSTFYGGSNVEEADFGFDNIDFDNCGNLYFAFQTQSADITTYNPPGGSYYDNSYGGGSGNWQGDVFITKFSSGTGNLLWATYLGAAGNDFRNALAVDPDNNLFITGEWADYTLSTVTGLPLLNPGAGTYFNNTPSGADVGYLVKFNSDPPPTYIQSQLSSGGCTCTGTATVNTSGGTPPYNYIWSNGSQSLTSSNASNIVTALCPGSYWVEVTDDACHRDTSYYTIPGNVSAAVTQTNVSCSGGTNGSAGVIAAGGTSPYTYNWSGGQTSVSVTGLSSGSYYVSITDAGGCIYQQLIIITEPMPVSVTGYAQATSCNINSGSIMASASGGTPAYTYNWNNAQTSQTATGLSAGIYTITVTDANGCSSIQTTDVTSVTPPNFSLIAMNGTCGKGGFAGVKVFSGTVPYTYTWSNGEKTQAVSLIAGTYTVTVSDANGCTRTKTASITTSPNPAVATFTQSPGGTVCTGTKVDFTHTGTPPGPVSYTWLISPITPSNVSSTTINFSYTFLSTGSYTVKHNVYTGGCSAEVESTVTVISCNNGPTVITTGSSVCPGSCATVTSGGLGGSSPYTYSWSNGASTQNINPCPVATTVYTVTINDSGGNTSTSTAVVTVNPAISAAITPTNISCNGGTNGSALATGGGGSLPYTYNWSTGATTSQISNLTSQIYTVTVSDSNGCTSVSTATVASPPVLTGQFSKGTANCIGCGCKEWVMVNATGGTGPYSFTWPDGYINRYKNQLCPGTYVINVKDKSGCSMNVNLTAP